MDEVWLSYMAGAAERLRHAAEDMALAIEAYTLLRHVEVYQNDSGWWFDHERIAHGPYWTERQALQALVGGVRC